MNFNYYYKNEAEQFSFYRIPKQLFTDKRFCELSAEAKILYGLLLDRMSLSIRNGWIDDENRVYIYFKVSEAMEYMNICKEKAVRLFAELDSEKGCGLIFRKRQGLGKPSYIYVMNFNSVICEATESKAEREDFKKSEKPTSGGLHSTDFKKSEKQTSGGLDSTDFKRSEKQTSGGSENRLQEVGNSDSNNTEINNTDFNDTEFILSDPMQDMMDRSLYEATIKKNIEYDSLIKTHKKEDIDGLLNIMLDVVCSNKPYLVISSEKTPTVLVTERMLRVRAKHIEYVMDSLKSNTTKVKNIKSYLLTMLYNSVSTIGHYYRAEASYDLGGGTL
ncbi:MAG: replication initiator protein A [Firmicutes bacterium]|nr:replication initiator protein A [Bacillota bacterium]